MMSSFLPSFLNPYSLPWSFARFPGVNRGSCRSSPWTRAWIRTWTRTGEAPLARARVAAASPPGVRASHVSHVARGLPRAARGMSRTARAAPLCGGVRPLVPPGRPARPPDRRGPLPRGLQAAGPQHGGPRLGVTHRRTGVSCLAGAGENWSGVAGLDRRACLREAKR